MIARLQEWLESRVRFALRARHGAGELECVERGVHVYLVGVGRCLGAVPDVHYVGGEAGQRLVPVDLPGLPVGGQCGRGLAVQRFRGTASYDTPLTGRT